MYIKDGHNTRKLMFVLADLINGKKVKPSSISCVSYIYDCIDFDAFDKFGKKISKGLRLAFASSRDDYPAIEIVLGNVDSFGGEWFAGHGTLYRYRDGKRDEWIKKTREYFNVDENLQFDSIYKMLKPYINRTSASAQSN